MVRHDHGDGGGAETTVALVSMPFAPLLLPSVALALLKAGLTGVGIRSRIHDLGFPFAKRIGPLLYQSVACPEDPEQLLGDWIFSPALFAGDDPDPYLREVLAGVPDDRIEALLVVREGIGPFLSECRNAVLADRPRIVGFTTTGFQHTASLALARKIKERRPETIVVLGGAACAWPMGIETARRFPFVDAVVLGEGDVLFPELVRRVLAGLSIDDLPGVATANGTEPVPPEPVADLDALPTPDFTDYRAAWVESGLDLPPPPMVVLETSRGCWWGERSRCSFCGLADFRFRAKSGRRALEEVREVLDRFPATFVSYADNVAPPGVFEDFLPALAEARLPVEVFYEVRPDVTRAQVRRLRDAGVRRIRSGIESLSTPVLRAMRKGVTGLHGIRLLKRCREFGIHAAWNFLWGATGEDPGEYERMARLLPLLAHLQPPGAAGPILLHRYSLDFDRAEERGFENVRPVPAYGHVYDLPPDSLDRMAYYFRFDRADDRDPEDYVGPLYREIRCWRSVASESSLLLVDRDDRLLIFDLRPVAVDPLTVVDGIERRLLLACDGIASLAGLAELTGESEDRVEERIAPLLERGLLVREGRRLLSLPVAVGESAPPPGALERLAAVADELGEVRDGDLVVPIHPA